MHRRLKRKGYSLTGPKAVRALVVMPTYNERSNLSVLVPEILRVNDVRLLVVDDASPDGTADEADRLAHESDGRVTVLRRTGPRGFGRSYVEGMRHALGTDATHICQMDADRSHDPADLRRLLAAVGSADLVIGSRYVEGGRLVNWPRRRRALSAFANGYVRTITGLDVRDCTSGFRCWDRRLLERLDFARVRSDGYAFLVELTWLAHRAGGRIVEVPITFVERRDGASKMSWHVIAESALLPWRLIRQPDRATLRVS
jgi:dolichol-phosphate mannosyltransferase